MSRTIDEKVVEMRFDNSNFEANVRQSMSTLDKLKSNLKFADSAKSFENIDRAANKVSFAGLNRGIDEVKTRISKLDMITNTVLSRMTNSVINFGTKIVTAIPNQIKSGGISRAMNIEQAKFQLKGLKVAWDDIKDDIDFGVSGTAYGLDAAAKAASQLVASGVKFGKTYGATGNSPMAKALLGISGVAAMTNSSYEEISHIFTTVAGQGKVMTLQLRELENRGLNAAAKLGEVLKVSEQEVRDMVTRGQIDFETFSNAMYDAFGTHAKDANEIFTGALANMKSALSRIGEDFVTPTMKNLTKLFNSVRNFFNNVHEMTKPIAKIYDILSTSVFDKISAKIDEINTLLDESGYKYAFIEGIAGILHGIYDRLIVIGEAFSEVFGFDTEEGIKSIAANFMAFSKALLPSKKELEVLKEVFKGFFNILKLFGQVLKVILLLLGKLGPFLAPLITIGGTIFLIAKGAGFLATKFSGLIRIISPLIGLLGGLSKILLVVGLIAGAGIGIYALVQNFDRIKESVKSFYDEILKPNVQGFFDKISKSIKNWYNNLKQTHPVLASFLGIFKSLGSFAIEGAKKIGSFFKNLPQLFGQGTWKNTFESISRGIDNIVNKLKNVNVIEKFSQGFSKLREQLSKLGQSIKNNGFFKGIGEFVKDIKGLFTKTNEIVAESGEVNNPIRTSGMVADLKEGNVHTVTLGESVEDLDKKTQHATSTFTAGKVALALFTGSMFALSLGIARATWGIGTLTSNVGRYISNFNLKKFLGININKIQNNVQSFAIVIATLAGSLAALALVDSEYGENLEHVFPMLLSLIAVTGLLSLAMTYLSKKFAPGDFSAGILNSFAISVAVMVGALFLLSKVPMEGIWKKVGVLAAIVGTLVAVQVIISRFAGDRKITKMSFNIIALCLGMLMMTKVLSDINNITGSPDQIAAKILGLVAVMMALSLFAAATGNIRLTSGLGFLIVVVAIRYFAAEIEQLLGIIKIDVLKQVLNLIRKYYIESITLAGIVAGLIVALGLAGKGISKIGFGFVLFASSLGIIALTMGLIDKTISKLIKQGTLGRTLIFMGLVGAFMLAMTGLAAYGKGFDKGKYAIRVGAMMLLVAGAFLMMEGALAIMYTIVSEATNIPALIGAVAILTVIMLLFTKMIDVARYATEKTNLMPIVGMIFGMTAVLAAVVALTAIMKSASVGAILGTIGAILAIMVPLSLVFYFLSKMQIKKGHITAVGTIAAIAIMLVSVVAGISLIAIYGNKENLPLVAVTLGALAGIIILLGVVCKKISSVKVESGESKIKAFRNVLLSLIPLIAAVTIISVYGNNLAWANALAVLGGVALVLGILSVLINQLLKSKSQHVEDKLEGLTTVILAIIPLVTALTIVSIFGKKDTLLSVVAVFGGVIAVLGTLILLINVLLEVKTDGVENKLNALKKVLFALIPVIGGLTAVSIFSTRKTYGHVATVFLGVTSILIVLSVLIHVLDKVKTNGIENKLDKVRNILLAMIPLIAGLTLVAIFSKENSWQNVLAVFGSLAVLLLEMGGIVLLISKVSDTLDNLNILAISAAFAIIGFSLIEVAASIMMIADNMPSPEEFKAIKDALGAFLGIASAIVGVAAIIGSIPGLNAGAAIVIIAIAGAFAILGFSLVEVSTAFATASSAIGDLAAGLNDLLPLLMAIRDIMNLGVLFKIGELAIGIAALGLAGIVCIAGAIGIALLGQALTGPFLDGIEAVGNLTSETLTKFGNSVRGLVDAMKPLEELSWTLGIVAASFFGFGLAALFAGIGIQKASDGLSNLIPIITNVTSDQAQNASIALASLADGLEALAWAGADLGLGALGLSSAGKWLPNIINSILTLSNGIGSSEEVKKVLIDLSAGLDELAGAGFKLNGSMTSFTTVGAGLFTLSIGLKSLPSAQELVPITKSLKVLVPTADALSGIGKTMGEGAGGMKAMGDALISMGAGLSNVTVAFQNIEAAIQKSFDVDTIIDIAEMVQKFQNVGTQIPQAVVDGINANGNMEKLRAAGIAMGDAISAGITDATAGLSDIINSANQNVAQETPKSNPQSASSKIRVRDISRPGFKDGATQVKSFNQGVDSEFPNTTAAGVKINTALIKSTEQSAVTNAPRMTVAGRTGASNVTKGIKEETPNVVTAAQQVGTASVDATVNASNAAAPKANTAGATIVDNFLSGAKNTLEQGKSGLQTFATDLTNLLSGQTSLQDFSAKYWDTALNTVKNTVVGGLSDIWNNATQQGNGILSVLGVVDSRMAELQAKYGLLKSKFDALSVDSAHSGQELAGLQGQMRATKKDMADLGSETDWVNSFLGDLGKTVGDLSDPFSAAAEGAENFGKSLDSAGGSASSAKDAFSDLKGTIEGQMDLFSEFNMKTEMTGEQMLNNMRSQIQGISTWASNMQQLALRGMAPGLLKKLGDLGPQGFEKVNAFMQMSQEQLAEANSLYAQSLVLPSSAADQVASSYGYAGQMTAQGFADGLGGELGGMNAAQGFGLGAINQVNTETGVGSPSWKTEQTGMYLILGLQLGINKAMPGLLQTVDTNMNRVVETFKTYTMPGGQFTMIGQSIQQAILNGITNAGTMLNDTMDTTGDSMGSSLSGNPLLTAFLGSFTYDNGMTFLDAFIMGIKDSINTAFGIEDETSTWTKELFLMLLQGILDSVEENYEDFEGEFDEKFLMPIKEKIEEYISYDAGYELAENIADGIIDGLNDKLDAVREAAAALGNAVTEGTSGAVKVASPSKVFRTIGYYIDKGLALGIKENTYIATRSTGYLADNITTRMNNVVSSIYSMINSNIDMQPTIAPVLDTTNIVSGARAINGIFASTNRNASITASGYNEMLHATKIQADLSKSSESRLQRDYAQAIIDAVNKSANTDTNLTVVLDGDAGKVFNLVRTENNKFINTTNFNPLAQGRG